MATRLGSSLWPTEIEDLNVLLDLLVHRGDDLLPAEKFHRLLRRILALEEDRQEPIRARELKRRISSAAILVAVALRNFSVQENHFATLSAWTLFSAYVIGACERHKVSFARSGRTAVHIAKGAVLDALRSICTEITLNPRLAPRAGLEIAPMYRARATLLYGLMSVYWMWLADAGRAIEAHSQFLADWIPRNFDDSYVWGEGAVPQVLAHYWYLSRTDPSWASEGQLASLLTAVISLNSTEPHQEFPTPYSSFEEVMRHRLAALLGTGDDPLRDETVRGTSYFAESLIHLLVRANLKQTAKGLWGPFSKLGLMRFDPTQTWQYCLFRTDDGQERMVQSPATKAWSALVDEARDCRVTNVPPSLLSEKFILLLFTFLMPHRATPEVVRFLGRQFGTVWFIPPPIE
jgi:hypothetical protein